MSYERMQSANACYNPESHKDPIIYCESCNNISCKYNWKLREVFDDEYLWYDEVLKLVQKRNLDLNK